MQHNCEVPSASEQAAEGSPGRKRKASVEKIK